MVITLTLNSAVTKAEAVIEAVAANAAVVALRAPVNWFVAVPAAMPAGGLDRTKPLINVGALEAVNVKVAVPAVFF